ncbi:MAG: ribosome-associated translation inhibitor RaiA [Acidimicrobiaceae bacterium]|nr:ribosome-associated translation inhibitor RaiA [Acidimicrobiaceae bacterium]
MDVNISSRHMSLTPKLEEAVYAKIGNLDRYLYGLNIAEVHFDEARNPRISDREICEITLSGHGHRLHCKVAAPDPFSALDIAEAKLERQIRKLRTKLQKRYHGSGQTIRG